MSCFKTCFNQIICCTCFFIIHTSSAFFNLIYFLMFCTLLFRVADIPKFTEFVSDAKVVLARPRCVKHIAFFLTHLSKKKIRISTWKIELTSYIWTVVQFSLLLWTTKKKPNSRIRYLDRRTQVWYRFLEKPELSIDVTQF